MNHGLSRDNVMIDRNGGFLIVNVGGFRQRDEYHCKNEVSELLERRKRLLDMKHAPWGVRQ
ncbi:hypothetical protein [Sporosarcina sp. P7]|uniref:hypothetical protein n=1 Tax=Sporosarcina sp. P7 TaxID=2048244 RepID=UPI000C16C759|nr:hypothetical protein [Sporosarcina sp. P7]PID24930.1 hypothetical protein CSV60_06625 [Sporosarcina sp. P7]